jgi:enoyl-CoA hydratase/carnithine racemase
MTSIPQGPTGLEAWPDILVRLTRAPFVSIALIRGRATGNGSEISLACERLGYVTRALPDAELDDFVDALAARIAWFDKWAIANTKRLVNAASLPPDVQIAAGWDACMNSIPRPAAQTRIKALFEQGFHRPGDAENRLGSYVGRLGH